MKQPMPIIQHKVNVFDFWTASQFYQRVFNLFAIYPTGLIKVNCNEGQLTIFNNLFMVGDLDFCYLETFLRATRPAGVINCTVEVFSR